MKDKIERDLLACSLLLTRLTHTIKSMPEVEPQKNKSNGDFKSIKQPLKREDLPDLLKVHEAAEYLRITKIDLYKIINETKDFPIIRFSERRTRIPKEAFLNWLEKSDGVLKNLR